MVTIEQRRKTDRKRRERWRQRKLTQGYKQIQLMITPEAQKVLKREKDRTGEPFVQIINRGIINLEKSLPSVTVKTETRPKTNVHPRVSEKIKPQHSVPDKTKAHPPEQLSLFIGSEK